MQKMFVRESNVKVRNYKCVHKGIQYAKNLMSIHEVRIRAVQEIKKVEPQYMLLSVTSGNPSPGSGKRRTGISGNVTSGL